MVNTRNFDALCDRLIQFAERDAIPIATVVAQEEMNRTAIAQANVVQPVEKPSVKKGWKLRKKGVAPSEPNKTTESNTAPVSDALVSTVKDKLQQYLNHSIKQWI